MFGQSKPGQQTGFTGFGTLPSTSAATSSGFTFGTSSSTLGSTTGGGFSFNLASSQPSVSNTVSTGQSQGFAGFGSTTSKPSLFGVAPASSSTTTGLSFGQTPQSLSLGTATSASATVKPAGTGFTFGLQPSSQSSTATTTTPSLSAFESLASTASTSAPAFASLATATTNKTVASTGFTFGAVQPTASTKSTTLNLGSTLTAAQKTTVAGATTGFTFGQATAPFTQATTQPSILLGATSQPASTNSTALGILGAKTEAAVQPLGVQTTSSLTTKVSTSLPPSTSNVSALGAAEKPITYKQLEDTINKWVHELDEQETVFLNQAKQVNIWDRLLIENGEKITQLNGEIQRLKTDQGRLDRELDFILSQQQELEEVLAPLEEQIRAQQSVPYMQHTDLERERTYKMAENIDSQLKRMMQDIKDIINHINTSNTNAKESDDPMTQIAKILNSHMDSLQWVDQNAALLQRKVDDVTKQVESRRREHERSLRLTFE